MSNNSHWYKPDGTSCYQVPYADPTKGMRPTTLADARKLGLLPSTTTILRVLDKPALNEWRIRNAIEATLTTPRNDGESVDDFAARVLVVDTESIADTAKQLGIDIHDGIEAWCCGKEYNPTLAPYILPVIAELGKHGVVADSEKILVGDGYAGKTDCITSGDYTVVWDFKTTKSKRLPTKSYPEHRLQLASYARCLPVADWLKTRTANIYISTINPGEITVCENDMWEVDYSMFLKCRDLWYWQNSFQIKG